MHLIFGGNVVEVGSVILTNGGCNSVQSSEYRLISAGIAHIKYDGFLNGNPFSFHPCLFFFLQSYLFFLFWKVKIPLPFLLTLTVTTWYLRRNSCRFFLCQFGTISPSILNKFTKTETLQICIIFLSTFFSVLFSSHLR